jgi:glycosyltransferase involved in cell wall biosynthesis
MSRTHLSLGCCTAVLDRPLFARLNMLQVIAQTVRPQFHSVVASGEDSDRRFIDDLVDDSILLASVAEPNATLSAYTRGLEELHAKGVNLFVCLDHDCVYKRKYLQAVSEFVRSAGLNADDGLFCLNLIDQQWITLYDDARADIEARHFRRGLGLSIEEANQVVVGAPPTFVFGRGAAEIVIERYRKSGQPATVYHDIFWRRVLLDAGIQITQVQTSAPVFAYVRHSNSLCWGGKPVGVRKNLRTNGSGNGSSGALSPRRENPATLARRNGNSGLDVSVVIPTYNEGDWLVKTVESILRSKAELRYEILVVNDGCTDGSIEAVADRKRVRIIETRGEQLGLVIAKNAGAKAARAKHLCFVDSHVLVHDYWLDYLRETCDAYPDGALISGNLPDTVLLSTRGEWDQNQYGYIIRNCMLGTGWHHYGRAFTNQPYLEPLSPGGLMFAQKAHFARLGGFESCLRKWGAEDIQISLQNFYLGGENVVDPRVVVFHYYKNSTTKKRSFAVSNAQHAFNCLHVAAAYFPYGYYVNVREAMAAKAGGDGLAAEIESVEHFGRLEKLRSEFVRGFDEWVAQFATELRKFLTDAERRSESQRIPMPGRASMIHQRSTEVEVQ